MVYEFLHEHGLVDFSAAADRIGPFFSQGQTILPAESSAAAAVADLMHLSAAEITLLLETPSSNELSPLRVSDRAAEAALSATDSGPFVGHDPREQLKLWDVTLLGSDASKLAWIAESDSVKTVADQFETVVQRLATLYEERGGTTGYGGREVFAVRAALWRARIAVLLEEDDLTPVLRVHSSLGEPEFA